MFGGNSNWRGPVWFPVNVLLADKLRTYGRFFGDSLTVEMPTGSGHHVTLEQAADVIDDGLVSLFRPVDGVRPSDGAAHRGQSDIPLWSEHPTFSEYFDGDTGEGLGATHQTGLDRARRPPAQPAAAPGATPRRLTTDRSRVPPPTIVGMEQDPQVWIAALRSGHDSLAEFVAGASADDLARRSMATEWSVAQVLSHLGSGAEIGLAGRTGEAIENEAVWARWNAKRPDDMASSFVEADEALVSWWESQTPEELAVMEVQLPFLPAPIDAAGSRSASGCRRWRSTAGTCWRRSTTAPPSPPTPPRSWSTACR